MTEAIQITKSEALRRIAESTAQITLATGLISDVNDKIATAKSIAKPDGAESLPMQA